MSLEESKNIAISDVIRSSEGLLSLASGNPATKIDGIASAEAGGASKLVFLATPKVLKNPAVRAAGYVVPKSEATGFTPPVQDACVLTSDQVELAMARVLSQLFQNTPTREPWNGIHPTAVVAASAQIHPSVTVGPYAVIGERVQIAEKAYIGAHSVIETEAQIGAGTTLHPFVRIAPRVVIGAHCDINSHSTIGKEGFGYAHDKKGNHFRIPHLGRVIVEDDVHIGAGVHIDAGRFDDTVICRGTKMDNMIHVAHNCRIGENSLTTAGFIVAGSTKIGKRFVCGGQTGVTGHIEICDDVQLAAKSGVVKSISEPGQYGGYPLLPLQKFLKLKAALVELPELYKKLRKL